MMTHERHAILTQEFADFLTDALIDSSGPEWTCSEGAWAIITKLGKEGRVTRMLEAFDPPSELYRTGPSIFENMAGCVEMQDCAGVGGWRTVAQCYTWAETQFITRALNAYAAQLSAPRFTPVDLLIEQMGEALFDLSDSLRESGFLNNVVHHERYEAVVVAWRGLSVILAKASADTHPKGGDVQQAPSVMGSAVPKADAQ